MMRVHILAVLCYSGAGRWQLKGGWNPTLRSEPSKLYSQGYGRMKLQTALQAERGVGTIGEAGSIDPRLQQTGKNETFAKRLQSCKRNIRSWQETVRC